MPRPPINLAQKIRDILRHVQPLPDEAKVPILHYGRTVADIWGALDYVERAIEQRERYQAVVDRHLGRLYLMALVNLVETFERFLKEVAAECVDCLAARSEERRVGKECRWRGSRWCCKKSMKRRKRL